MTITKDIRYIGVNDHAVDLFEGQYVVPGGMCYNSYAIVDEKVAIMDTVDRGFTHQWLDNIQDTLGGRKPDYLVVQHMEPDHSANIANFLKVYPEATVVSSAKAFVMMKNFFGDDYADRRIVVLPTRTIPQGITAMLNFDPDLKPEENAASLVEEIQTLEEYKGDVVNILVCGIDYEDGRGYSSDGTNDGMTDMILYCQFDIKGGALRMLQIPRNSLVATKNRKITLSNGKTYSVSNYQINSVALSNGGNVAALAEVIYDQFKLPIDYYVTIDMQALVEMVDNFGGIEVYIPHDMSFAGSALKQGYRNLDGASAEFFVRCRHGEGYSNSDIDRLNMQRYFYAGLFKRVRSMGVTDVINQLPLIFNNYIHTDMDLTTIAKMLVSFTRIDSANIMLAQTPVFMGVPNVGKTDTFAGYSCVAPDAGSIANLAYASRLCLSCGNFL